MNRMGSRTYTLTEMLTLMAPNTVAPNETERKSDLPRGTYARIGRRLRPQVSGEFVGMVDRGLRRSARVEAALRRVRDKINQSEAA